VSATNEEVCPLKLLRALQSVTNPNGDDYIFRGFNGRLVAKNSGKTTPRVIASKYAQYMRYLSLWFGGIFGLTPEEFKGQYGSQSIHIGPVIRKISRASPWNFGVNMVIGLHSKVKTDT